MDFKMVNNFWNQNHVILKLKKYPIFCIIISDKFVYGRKKNLFVIADVVPNSLHDYDIRFLFFVLRFISL